MIASTSTARTATTDTIAARPFDDTRTTAIVARRRAARPPESARITAIVARQRAGRLRDLWFAAALSIGLVLGLGALQASASAPAAPTPGAVPAAG